MTVYLGHHNDSAPFLDAVTVMLVGRPEETILPKLRAQWLREIHLDIIVIKVDDVHGDDDSQGSAEFAIQTLGYGPSR